MGRNKWLLRPIAGTPNPRIPVASHSPDPPFTITTNQANVVTYHPHIPHRKQQNAQGKTVSLAGIREFEARRIMLRTRSWIAVAHYFQQQHQPNEASLFPEIGHAGVAAP